MNWTEDEYEFEKRNEMDHYYFDFDFESKLKKKKKKKHFQRYSHVHLGQYYLCYFDSDWKHLSEYYQNYVGD